MLFFRVRGYCILLTKIEAISLCLSWLFEEVLSMLYLWNIERKTNYPRAIWEFEISHQTFVIWQKTLLDAIWTRAYLEPLQGSKMEYFWTAKLDTQKQSILDVWRDFEYVSAEKQARCKVSKRNSRRCLVKC